MSGGSADIERRPSGLALAGHMKPIVQFVRATVCRAGEIHGLEWSRVDLARNVAWLDHGTTKTGEGRGIPVNADAVAALEATRGKRRRWCFTLPVRASTSARQLETSPSSLPASRTSVSTT
jgi:integrase